MTVLCENRSMSTFPKLPIIKPCKLNLQKIILSFNVTAHHRNYLISQGIIGSSYAFSNLETLTAFFIKAKNITCLLSKIQKMATAPLGKLIRIGIDADNVRFVCY